MAELDGNPVIEQAPSPAPAPAAPAPAPEGKTESAPSPEPQETDDIPFVFTRPKSEKKTEPTLDPKTIPPELEPFYKSMQADYTRKTQDVARRTEELQARLEEFQKNQQAFFDVLKAQQTRPPEDNGPDVFQQAQALREEGRYQDADRLLYDHAQQVARAEIQPYKEQAQLENLKSTFRDVASEAFTSNPVASAYKEDVIKIFDQKTPLMNEVRAIALKDERSIKTFVPMLLHFIATEQHAIKLEKSFNAKVEKEVKARLEAERSQAGRLPSRLVESGSTSRSSPTGEMSLAESFEFALSKLGKA